MRAGWLGETPGGGGGEPRLHGGWGAQWLEGVSLGKVNPQGRPSWGSSHSGKEQEPGLLDEVADGMAHSLNWEHDLHCVPVHHLIAVKIVISRML